MSYIVRIKPFVCFKLYHTIFLLLFWYFMPYFYLKAVSVFHIWVGLTDVNAFLMFLRIFEGRIWRVEYFGTFIVENNVFEVGTHGIAVENPWFEVKSFSLKAICQLCQWKYFRVEIVVIQLRKNKLFAMKISGQKRWRGLRVSFNLLQISSLFWRTRMLIAHLFEWKLNPKLLVCCSILWLWLKER